MSEQSLEQLLYASQFDEASGRLAAGEKLSKAIQPHQTSQIIDNLLRAEQYEILLRFLEDQTIDTDIYELDNFDRSIFKNLAINLKDDEPALIFFRELLSRFDNLNDEVDTKTLLGYFLEKGASVEKVKVLIDAGCDVNFKNNADENFIHQIIRTNLRKPELSSQYLELMIAEGLDVNEPNIVKKTPIIQAIEFNHPEYLNLLLQNGADPAAQDKDSNSAFYYALAHKQDLDLYLKLSEFTTADFDTINREGVSMLFEFLRMAYPGEKTLELFSTLLKDGADLYQNSTYYGRAKAPIDLLSEKQLEFLAAALTSGQIDINRQDDHGNTLLHKVCAYNVNFEAEKAKETYRKVKLLLEHGADVTIHNDQDKTAVDLASDDNLKIKTVELLMRKA